MTHFLYTESDLQAGLAQLILADPCLKSVAEKAGATERSASLVSMAYRCGRGPAPFRSLTARCGQCPEPVSNWSFVNDLERTFKPSGRHLGG